MDKTASDNPLAQRRVGVWPWLLILVGAATYANSLSGSFIWDDFSWVNAGRHIRQLWPPAWFDSALPNSVTNGRPLVALTYAINYAVGGLDVRGFHIVNIALHIACALTLFGVVRRTLEGDLLAGRFGRSARGLAGVTALLWMTHPLLTESVDYLSQRTVLLMGLFYLLTMYCAIRAARSEHSRGWSVAAVVCCCLGAAGKQVIVTAPAMVFLYDWALRTEPFRAVFRRRWPLYAGLVASWGVLAALMSAFPDVNIGLGNEVGPWQYALNQCSIIIDYLRLTFWPHPLVLDYGYPASRTVGEVAPYGLLLMGLLAVAVWTLLRKPPIGYAAAWFFITLSPTSSFVPIAMEVGAERRMYLPLAGLIVLIVVGVHGLLKRLAPRSDAQRRRIAATATSLVTLALICVSLRRNHDYRGEIAIWATAVAARPDNPRPYTNLGLLLAKAGKADEALANYEQALRLDPDFVKARNNLALLLMGRGRRTEAIKQFRLALKTAPNFSEARTNLGAALMKMGRTAEAVAQYRLALKPRPDLAATHVALGAALATRGEYAEALAQIREGIRLDPDNADSYFNLGTALARRRDLGQAIEAFRRAIQLAPDSPRAHFSLGLALWQSGDGAAALRSFRNAAHAKPDWPDPLVEIARILATHPDANIRDGAEAVRIAERAATLSKRPNPRLLDTLAAAYAAAGRFDHAVTTATKAAELAQRAGATRPAAEIRRRIDLYKRGEPYVERP